MSEPPDSKGRSTDDSADAIGASVASNIPFGPLFFLEQLRAFVRDRCPPPGEGLPVLELHLVDGEVLDVCHVIGLASTWLALAVHEKGVSASAPTMRTELVPYDLISRVTIRSARPEGPHLGFDYARASESVGAPAPERAATPEEALRAAAKRAGRTRGGGASGARARRRS